MANRPQRRPTARPADDTTGRPKIWVDGSQRPPFDIRALGRASLFFARSGAAVLFAALALWVRRMALKVRDGAGRIPEARLGRFARYVPSHLRVAMWVKNCAAVQAHASATADPDAPRGNALVAEVEAHLWAPDAVEMPPPPGQAAATTIQIIGYLCGWAGAITLLPYGLARALIAFAMGQDLRTIGTED